MMIFGAGGAEYYGLCQMRQRRSEKKYEFTLHKSRYIQPYADTMPFVRPLPTRTFGRAGSVNAGMKESLVLKKENK